MCAYLLMVIINYWALFFLRWDIIHIRRQPLLLDFLFQLLDELPVFHFMVCVAMEDFDLLRLQFFVFGQSLLVGMEHTFIFLFPVDRGLVSWCFRVTILLLTWDSCWRGAVMLSVIQPMIVGKMWNQLGRLVV